MLGIRASLGAHDSSVWGASVVHVAPESPIADDDPTGERALAELAERYRLLVDLSPDAIAVHAGGIVEYANQAAVRYARAESAAELVGRPITDFLHPSSVPEVRARLAGLTNEGDVTPPHPVLMQPVRGELLESEVVSVRTVWAGRPAFQVIIRDLAFLRAAESAVRFRAALVEHVSDAIIATTADGIVASWNPAAEEIYGRSAAEAVGLALADAVGAEFDAASVVADGGSVDTTHRAADGTEIAIRASVAEMAGGYVLVCHADPARRRAQERFRSVVATLREAVVVVDAAGRIENANPAARRLFGGAATVDELGLLDRTGSSTTNLFASSVRVRDRWLTVSSGLLEPDRADSAIVASFVDITDQRTAAAPLRHAATHDGLTDLVNRTAVIARLDELLGADGAAPTFVSFVDLNDFKTLNDSLGHWIGDRVLRAVGHRLGRGAVHADDIVGRIGGDEFVVVTMTSDLSAADEAGRIRSLLASPIDVEGRQLRVDASVGAVEVGAGRYHTSTELLRDADIAMYDAKTRRSGCAVFNIALREQMQRRQRIEQDLRRPETTAQLSTEYQPIVDLRTGRMRAVEALLRWNHPTLGAISPAEFVPLAEETDLIDMLTRFVVARATNEIATVISDHPRLRLSINLSARQITDPTLVSTIADTLAATAFAPTTL